MTHVADIETSKCIMRSSVLEDNAQHMLSVFTFGMNLKMNQTFKSCEHGEVRLAINTLGTPLPVVLSATLWTP